jgi:uncharacterized protein with HEPN domain
MIRDRAVYIADMTESIMLIQQYLEGIGKEELAHNTLLQDAVYRRFEIIGEAASQLPESFRLDHPDVEWNLMKAMRNRMIHNYFGIRVDVVFDTVRDDLPPLLTKLEKILAHLDQAQPINPA